MVPIQSIKKRAFLRQLCEGAKENALTVREALLAAQKACSTPSFQVGKILVSTSGSGQSGNFEMTFTGKEWTADNVFGLTEELLELLESLSVTDDASPGSTDLIFTAMIQSDALASVRQSGGDFTLLGYPYAR